MLPTSQLEGKMPDSHRRVQFLCDHIFNCSIGTCQRYLGQSNLCNNFYKSTDYIFTAMNQTVLSMELDDRVLPILSGDNVECRELISKVVCHYFFAPCGENGLLHLPLSVCHEECHYVESTCASEWIVINNLLSNAQLSPIDCNSTSTLLKHLDPCCIDAEIDMKSTYSSLSHKLTCDLYALRYRCYNKDSCGPTSGQPKN